jgi:metal-responsive CopG/Arc/MetJ family transcriptional regulator
MKAEQLKKMLTNKTAQMSVRIAPELLRRFSEAIEKDPDYQSRNEFIEIMILRYLESKGKL